MLLTGTWRLGLMLSRLCNTCMIAPPLNDFTPVRAALRKDPAVAQVIASWRRLTGGKLRRDRERRTLVACSGGADSSALALALAATGPNLVMAHIIHDMRARPLAQADALATEELASTLGVEYCVREITVSQLGGNTEAAARNLRYEALAAMASEFGCPFIATGHHANDQMETLLMRLIQGRSVAAMAGIRRSRPCHGVMLVRPMLGVLRTDVERICGLAGWQWRRDHTNDDLSRLRNALRAQVVPALNSIAPLAVLGTARTARRLADAASAVRAQARQLLSLGKYASDGVSFPRETLAAVPEAVLGELMIMSALKLDVANVRFGSVIDSVVVAITGTSTEPKTFQVGAVCINVRANTVLIERKV